MEVINVIIYVIAILSYLFLIVFAVLGMRHAYRVIRAENNVYHEKLLNQVYSIQCKLHCEDCENQEDERERAN